MRSDNTNLRVQALRSTCDVSSSTASATRRQRRQTRVADSVATGPACRSTFRRVSSSSSTRGSERVEEIRMADNSAEGAEVAASAKRSDVGTFCAIGEEAPAAAEGRRLAPWNPLWSARTAAGAPLWISSGPCSQLMQRFFGGDTVLSKSYSISSSNGSGGVLRRPEDDMT